MATITKRTLASKVRKTFGFKLAQSRKLVDVLFEELGAALVRGEEVKFTGLGGFKILDKSARMARNPKTGEAAIVSARRVVSFRPCNKFRATVGNRPIKMYVKKTEKKSRKKSEINQ